MTDFEWTVYGDIIVSGEVAESFRRVGFSGVGFPPVELYSSTETPFGRESFEVRANGWGGCAPADSGVRIMQECPYCKRRVFSGYTRPERIFDLEAWDGSDVFLIWPLPRYIMVTGRVRELILDSRYSGVRVRALGELPMPIAGKLGPGHLADWFDAPRVVEIEQGTNI
jgi:hypothetical protein